MSSLNRPLSGDSLNFDLPAEVDRLLESAGQGRSARTLLKDGPLRVTLIAVAAGGGIAEHSAEGPITVHVLRGEIRFVIGSAEHRLRTGHLLAVAPGVRHAVSADEDAAFLLTVVHAAADPEGD